MDTLYKAEKEDKCVSKKPTASEMYSYKNQQLTGYGN